VTGRWVDTTPVETARWLADVDAPWWIAGGWAIELWLGRGIRPHSDLEIGCLQRDLPHVLPAFDGWEIAVARNRQLTPLTGDPTHLERPFSLWLRRRGQEQWDLEVLAEDSDGDRWLYRRDHRVSRPIHQISTTASGYRVIRPEIQLLFKSKEPRPKDIEDFRAALPALDADACDWLVSALGMADPNNPWLADLRR
jgi:hypothetical protein